MLFAASLIRESDVDIVVVSTVVVLPATNKLPVNDKSPVINWFPEFLRTVLSTLTSTVLFASTALVEIPPFRLPLIVNVSLIRDKVPGAAPISPEKFSVEEIATLAAYVNRPFESTENTAAFVAPP